MSIPIASLTIVRPQEVLLGQLNSAEKTETHVWMRGGLATEFGGGIIEASRPAVELTEGTVRQFFVMARRFSNPASPANGQLYIDEPDSLIVIVDSQVLPVSGDRTWLDDVLAIGRELGPPIDNTSETRLFLDTVRHLRLTP